MMQSSPSGLPGVLLQKWRQFLVGLLVLFARIYQGTLSPIIGGQCRYMPSCSHYFVEAVQTHGPLRGLAMGLWRILRCNPLFGGGYDPVPQRRSVKPIIKTEDTNSR